MKRTTKQFTISLPPDMGDLVIATAKAESRTVSELFREAFRAYREQRINRLLAEFQREGEANNHNGYTVDDIPRLIREVRDEDIRNR